MSLPKDDAARKRIKPFAGFGCYFPDAIAAVAELSFLANEKHNPGEPMHWAKGKSTEHRESVMRHLLDEAAGGPMSRDQYEAAGKRWAILHAVSVAWRAMAQLQTLADQGHNIFAEELVENLMQSLHRDFTRAERMRTADLPEYPPQGVMPCNNATFEEGEPEDWQIESDSPGLLPEPADGFLGMPVTGPATVAKLLDGLRTFHESTGKPPKRLHIGRRTHDELVQELESPAMNKPGTVEYVADYATFTLTEFCGIAVRKIGDDEGYPPYAFYFTNC